MVPPHQTTVPTFASVVPGRSSVLPGLFKLKVAAGETVTWPLNDPPVQYPPDWIVKPCGVLNVPPLKSRVPTVAALLIPTVPFLMIAVSPAPGTWLGLQFVGLNQFVLAVLV